MHDIIIPEFIEKGFNDLPFWADKNQSIFYPVDIDLTEFLGKLDLQMKIAFANGKHFRYISENDKHISKIMIQTKIVRNEILIASEKKIFIGFLRFGYFWDNIPFLNILYLDKAYRRKGIGRQFVSFWENQMREMGYKNVMTSSLSDESAQYFYRKLGYKDSGSLLLENEPLEIFFTKHL